MINLYSILWLLQNLKPFNGRIKSSIFYEDLIWLYLSEELRILIASGATGGTSEGSVGKYFHLKDFGDALTKFNIDYQLVRETDYVVGFPTKHLSQRIIEEISGEARMNLFVKRWSNVKIWDSTF